jgi:hypothetical protein
MLLELASQVIGLATNCEDNLYYIFIFLYIFWRYMTYSVKYILQYTTDIAKRICNKRVVVWYKNTLLI